MKYKYCPQCGSGLKPKMAGDDGEVPFCYECNRYWFDSFESCVIVLVYNEFDEIVVCMQDYISKVYGTITAGYILPGENAEETAYREVEEELGIKLDNLHYGGTYWFEDGDKLMHAFMAYSPKCELKLSQEVNSAQWVKATKAHKVLFPDSPGNAAMGLLKQYAKMKNLQFED